MYRIRRPSPKPQKPAELAADLRLLLRTVRYPDAAAARAAVARCIRAVGPENAHLLGVRGIA